MGFPGDSDGKDTVSCFLFPWTPCEQASSSGCNRGTLPGGYFPVCPKASTIFCALVAVAQAGEGSSVFNLFLYQGSGQWKLWAQVRYLADFLAGYEGDSSAHFSHCFFLLSFSPSLHLCHCSQKYWAGHHLPISESCVWNFLPKIGTQTHVAGTLCYA